MKRHPLSLIELLVCLVFLSLIMTSLLSFLSRYSRYSHQLSQIKYEELNRQKCLFRLKSLLLQSTEGVKELENGFTFSFDNGVDVDPLFCHTLKAKVEKNKEALLLSYGPDEAHQRQEILYTPLKNFSYTLDTDQALILSFNDKPYPLFLKP